MRVITRKKIKKLVIVKQILLGSILGNVWRAVWRKCIHVSMLGVKGLKVVIGLTSNDEIFFLLPLVPLIFKSVSEKKRMQCRFFYN